MLYHKTKKQKSYGQKSLKKENCIFTYFLCFKLRCRQPLKRDSSAGDALCFRDHPSPPHTLGSVGTRTRAGSGRRDSHLTPRPAQRKST